MVEITPFQDAIIAIHPGYGTANNSADWAEHFAGICQPGNSGGWNVGRGLMEFDLSIIPPDAQILAASLSLTAKGPSGPGEVSEIGHVGDNIAQLSGITTPWNAATVTWNTQPSTTPTAAVTIGPSSHPMENHLNIDVTELVQAMHAAPTNSHGFQLSLANEGAVNGMVFHSTEGSLQDKWPRLLIVFGDCSAAQGLAQYPDRMWSMTAFPTSVERGTPVVVSGGDAKGRIELTDMSGRSLQVGPLNDWPTQLHTGDLRAGGYILSVVDDIGVRRFTTTIVVR